MRHKRLFDFVGLFEVEAIGGVRVLVGRLALGHVEPDLRVGVVGQSCQLGLRRHEALVTRLVGESALKLEVRGRILKPENEDLGSIS